MTVLTVIVIVLTAAVLAVWTSRHVLIGVERRRGFVLTEDFRPEPPIDPERLGKVSVVVAAKDEQDNIGPCVESMLAQDYPDFEVIVVNDRSTDETGRIAEEIARRDGRVRVVHVHELPPGWLGKNNAMQRGIAQARGEWLCMIDADCRQCSERSLRAAVEYALHSGADLLSVLPNLEMRSFWERVVQPVCGGIMMIWFHPDRVNDPAKPHAYANGAFMLMRRQAYERIGTHRAVRDKFNEDMEIARLTKQTGLRLRVVRNRGLYLVRMYSGLGQILRGWTRIFFGTFQTPRRLGVSLAVLLIMGLLPYAAAALGVAVTAAGAAGVLGPTCALVGAAAAGMQLSVIYRFYRLIGARAELAWTYPLGCCIAIAAVVVALTKLRKGATMTWRNTTYTPGGG